MTATGGTGTTRATGTGRLLGELGPGTRRVVYGEPTPAELAAELALMTRVDRAHLVMLAERGLIQAQAAARLLRCIDELAAGQFSALRDRPAPRGLYLMYEGYLIERLGPEVGGVLQSGRSRNDLKATITLLRLREWLLDFAEQAVRLEAILLSRARAHRDVLMPPTPLPGRDADQLRLLPARRGRRGRQGNRRAGRRERRTRPVSARGQRRGGHRPADRSGAYRAAARLHRPARHAIDAVASRDVPLRLLACAASLAVVLSRLGTDLQLWSTAEFGFIEFPTAWSAAARRCAEAQRVPARAPQGQARPRDRAWPPRRA